MHEAMVVADRSGLEAVERRRLLRALVELCDEVCAAEPREPARDGDVIPEAWRPAAVLGSDDEELVAGLRFGLGRLATGVGSGGAGQVATAVRRRLDGAEFVMRREIMMGQGERLPRLLPSFVFLVVLPLLGHAEALRVSERAARLLGVAT